MKLFAGSLFRDLRLGAISLTRNPSFSGVALLTLTAAIGASTAMFSVLNCFLLQPLPFFESERLVALWWHRAAASGSQVTMSILDHKDLESRLTQFDAIAARLPFSHTLEYEERTVRIEGEKVSSSYFDLAGVAPLHGRFFSDVDDDLPRGHLVTVLGHGLWQREFGGEPGVVGQNLVLDGESHHVIGIAPQGFRGLESGSEIWTPYSVVPPRFAPFLQVRGARPFYVYGRLSGPVTLVQAKAEFQEVLAALQSEYPEPYSGYSAELISLRDQIMGNLRVPLLLLVGGVVLVLFVSLANIANLLLARGESRRPEIALRLALGSGRVQLIRQLATENLVLAGLSGALGLLLAYWCIEALPAIPLPLPDYLSIQITPQTGVFTLALSLITALLLGTLSALQLGGTDLKTAVSQGGRVLTASARRSNRLRSGMVTTQFALALVLLVGAGLLVRSFRHLLSVEPGFSTEGIITARVDLPDQRYDFLGKLRFADQFLERLREHPSIAEASISSDLPLAGGGVTTRMALEGQSIEDRERLHVVVTHEVSPGYHQTLGTRLLAGRMLEAADRADTAPVVLLNDGAARALWPGGAALDRRIRFVSSRGLSEWYRVVGVVEDVRFENLAASAANRIDVYLPMEQAIFPFIALNIAIRGETAGTQAQALLRETLSEFDAGLILFGIQPMSQLAEDNLRPQRFLAFLSTLFALVALVLAVSGTFGLVTFQVSRRRREIGVRMALGASNRQIIRMVAVGGIRLTLLGLALGAAGCWFMVRPLESQLYGIAPLDPLTVVMAAAVMSTITIGASLFPARSAIRIDPARVLTVG